MGEPIGLRGIHRMGMWGLWDLGGDIGWGGIEQGGSIV